MRAVIFANGHFPGPAFIRAFLVKDDCIICADGGAAHALALGLAPRLVVGDMDSLCPDSRRMLQSRGIPFKVYPAAKDHSDLELALQKALELHPEEIVFLGALGGRIDHAFVNIMLLLPPLERGIPARIVDENQELRVFKRELVLEGKPGDMLSLFPLDAAVSGVVTEGLVYPLRGETLCRGSTRGLSNAFKVSRARITAGPGLLLAVKTTASEPSRT